MKAETFFPHHAGGFEITSRAISFCSFPPKAKIIDIGCGSGITVNYLTQELGFEAIGIDRETESTCQKNNLLNASGEALPFPEDHADGIFMECSFSMMSSQKQVLKECYRTLRKNGWLVISDMYARGEPARLTGYLGWFDTKDQIISLIENSGFRIKLFEDWTHSLKSLWGQMILKSGSDSFYGRLGVSYETIRRIKPGYYLIVASKNCESA